MNTSQIKTFAQQLRIQLREGVKQRLLYWGFNDQGEVIEQPETVEGGYMFRGQVYSDETVPNRWKQLKRTIDLHDVDYVVEEGAYTWFNRLMAIRILEKNDYIQSQLEYEEGTFLPRLLQNARRGIFPEMQGKELDELNKQLRDNKDNEAFARLLTHYCDTQPLISSVFGKISFRDDYTEMLLPQNLLDQGGILEFIVNTASITDEDYQQVELIGWLYQYYISEKKDQVFKSFKKRKKAGEEEIPAATQIFTPEWIVRYMVENTIGRLWFDLHPNSPLKKKMDYYVEPAEANPKAAPIISDVTELTLLDPASGSGHILVVGFEYLIEMYREEGYTARQSVNNILKNNIYGLEIDERAAQLARFAVLLKAAKYDKNVLEGEIEPHIYSYPEKASISTAELRELLGSEGEQFVDQLRDSIDLLQEGKNFGSTIQLQISEETVDFAKQRMQILRADAIENLTVKALINKIGPYLNIIELLTKKYKAIAANPPYMGRRNMNGELKQFLTYHYPNSNKDLFAVFIEVGLNLIGSKGHMGMINQQSWMFLSSYRKLREWIIDNFTISSLLHLGPNAFDEISGEVVQTVAFIINKNDIENYTGKYYGLVDGDESKIKEQNFLNSQTEGYKKRQQDFNKIPTSPIAYWADEITLNVFEETEFLNYYIHAFSGIITGNNSKFLKYWFEVDIDRVALNYEKIEDVVKDRKNWIPYNKGGEARSWYGNNEYVLWWEDDGSYLQRNRSTNSDYYLKEGITWTDVTSSQFTARFFPKGHLWDASGSSLFVLNDEDQNYILGFLNSKVVNHILHLINPTLHFQLENVLQLPIRMSSDSDKLKIGKLVNTTKKIAKLDWDRSELSWDFRRHEIMNYETDNLYKSIIKTKEYYTNTLFNLNSIEEEINQIFIKIFGLQSVLDSKKDVSDSTILQDVLERKKINANTHEEVNDYILVSKVIKSFLSYCIGCLFGRYCLLKDGLYIASPNSNKDLTYQINSPLVKDQKNKVETFIINEDGLIPLIGSNSPFSDDIAYQMKKMIHFIWGEQSLTDNLNYVQKKLGQDLEKYLTEKFWDYHVKLYSKRPIYWLFSSKKGAFKILAYMHRIDKYTAQKVRQNYLHPFIDYLRNDISSLESKGSLQSDESKRLDSLRSKLVECVEYDDVIKKVADKQIEIDLDDGVSHNYELFGDALAKI